MTKKKKVLLGLIAGIGLGCSTPMQDNINNTAPVEFVNQKYKLNVTELTQIDPAYLFVYSWNLYENGKKDDSIVWFYIAQYRAMIISVMENEKSTIPQKLYKQLAEDAGTPLIGKVTFVGGDPKRGTLYNYIHSGLGPTINSYAGTNFDNWIKQIQKVVEFEKANPFDPFKAIPAEQLDASKYAEGKEMADGISELIKFIEEHKAELEQQRKQFK